MTEQARALLRWCESEAGWVRRATETLVGLESPSTDKAAVDRCGAEIASMLRGIGGRVETFAQPVRGDHLLAEFPGGGRRVLLLGHFDTVWPVGQLQQMPMREEQGRLYGPGVFDMKSGLAVSMLALRILGRLPADQRPTVEILWTSDEEIGSGSSRALIEREARRSDAVLVLEPSLPGGAAKTSRKGCGDFELTVHGIAAHAGIDPGQGASAILEIAHQIIALHGLMDPSRGVSVNVGIVAGGTRTNVVPAEAHANIDIRVPTAADGERIARALQRLQPRVTGTRLEIQGGFDRPPLERGDHVARLYEVARQAAADIGFDLGEGGTGGGSDGNFTAALGVPTLDGLGPRGDGAHARHEHVEIVDLPWRAAFLAHLLVRLERGAFGDRGAGRPTAADPKDGVQ
jgi:glutamate carboxypeptidase